MSNDSPSRTTIITLKASDADLREDGKLAYRFEKSNASGLWELAYKSQSFDHEC